MSHSQPIQQPSQGGGLLGQEALEALFESLVDGVAIMDLEDRVVMVNRAFAQRLNVSPETMLGRKCHAVFHGMATLWMECPHHVSKATGAAARAQVKEPVTGLDVDIIVAPFHDRNGQLLGYVHVSRDITEQKRLQAQVLQSEKLAALGQLIAGVAHEINNPLTSVLGYSQLLYESIADPSLRGDAERIHREAERTQRIVQNLLSFARQHQPERTAVDLNGVLRDTLALRTHDYRMKNIRVELDLEPMPVTQADPYQLQQVFLNLILNAEQAMLAAHGRGTLRVRSRLIAQETVGGTEKPPFVEIRIEDDGPGIPKEQQHRIFEPFFTTKPVGEGTGLGLSIAFGIVAEHGGRIYAISQEGRGTTIVIELPVRPPESPPEADRAETPTPAAEPARVLVVDDEDFITRLVSRVLEPVGHGVSAAGSGAEALNRLREEPFDVILCDVRMPGMDGLSLWRQIQEERPQLAKRFVFFTGDMASPEIARILEQTGRPALQKPFTVDELQSAIRVVMEEMGHVEG